MIVDKSRQGRPRIDAKQRFDAEPYDEHGLRDLAQRFYKSMAVKNYSKRTIEIRDHHLRYFITWCEERDLRTPVDITKPILERYQSHIYHYRKSNGQPLAVGTQNARLVTLRAYFRWLTRENLLLSNPASEIDGPRMSKNLPRNILSLAEVEALLRQPDINDKFGLRDRAILEVFYSSGIRRREMIKLQLEHVDWSRETLFIREGKGNKDRFIPIGERALLWINKYLEEVRPVLHPSKEEKTLFLNYKGKPVSDKNLTYIVKQYLLKAGIEKTGACHILRHTVATLMLENGADIRYIQELLGHTKLETTEIYTRVTITKLKEVHKATHPAKMVHSKK